MRNKTIYDIPSISKGLIDILDSNRVLSFGNTNEVTLLTTRGSGFEEFYNDR